MSQIQLLVTKNVLEKVPSRWRGVVQPSLSPEKGNWVSTSGPSRLNQDTCLHLLISGILVLQLLKDPEMKTSLPPSDQRITVGRACCVGFTESSKSCCHDTNSLVNPLVKMLKLGSKYSWEHQSHHHRTR